MNAVSKGRSLLAKAQLLELSPQDVHIPARIGFLHEDKAAALGRLMAVDGQRDPIKVVAQKGEQPWRLVTGMHRLMGANYEGIPVFAIEVTGKAEDLADLEASENLHRRNIEPLERAKFVNALATVARERLAREHGETLSDQQLAIKARWARAGAEERRETVVEGIAADTAATIAAVYNWQDSVCAAMGLAPRTIRDDLRLHRYIVEPFPELVEMLAKHPEVGANGKALKDIANIESEDKRRAVIEILIDSDATLAEAMAKAGAPSPSQPAATPVHYEKYCSAIHNNFSKLGLSEKRLYLPRFVALLSPDLKAQLRTLLTEGEADA